MRGVDKEDMMGQVAFIARLFGVAAQAEQEVRPHVRSIPYQISFAIQPHLPWYRRNI